MSILPWLLPTAAAALLLATDRSIPPAAPTQDPKPLTTLIRPGDPKPAAQKMLFHTTSGTTAPHRSVLPFDFGVTAREAGHEVSIFLAGDATLLMKDAIAADVKAVGQPGVAELVRKCVELGIPIYI